MKITQLEYRELYSPTGGHNNFTLGAVTDVVKGEDPDEILEDLKNFVRNKMIQDHGEYRSVKDKKWKLESDCMRLEHKINNLRREHRDQIAAFNGTLEHIMNNELPF